MALPSYFELIPAFQQFLDSSGNPLSGGKVKTYVAGTSTPKVTYRESDGAVSNGSEMTIQPDGYLQYGAYGTTGAYKITVENSLGSILRTRDNVTSINDIARNGWVLIESKTAANSTTLDFVTGFTSYSYFMLKMSDLVPATDNTSLRMRTSVDGVNFDSGASDYGFAAKYLNSDPTEALVGDAAQDYIDIITALGNASGENCSLDMEFNTPSSAASKIFRFRGAYISSSGTLNDFQGTGRRISNSVIRGIRFYMSSGNISSGSIDLYGLED